MFRYLLPLFILLTTFQAFSAPHPLAKVVEKYIKTYQQRADFDGMMDFYDNQAQLEDMVYGHKAGSKAEIKAFFNWSQDNFEVLDGKPAITIEETLIDDNSKKVVISGVFNRFRYMQKNMGPWRFSTRLHFNQANKIIYQQDWINYTPKAQFMTGKNLNPSIEAIKSRP